MRLSTVLYGPFVGNYWKRYIQRKMREVNGYDKYVPLVGWQVHRTKRWRYNQYEPWESYGQAYNKKSRPYLPVEPIKKWSIFVGDRVQAMSGKDKGKQGIVERLVKERNWCYVSDLNLKYIEQEVDDDRKDDRFARPLVAQLMPLLVTSEVKLVDPEDNLPTDIDWKFTEDGEEVRVSRRTGRTIGLPMEYENFTEGDNINVKRYRANELKDTSEEDLKKITFTPTLATFEQDLMDRYGIFENRKPPKTYWY